MNEEQKGLKFVLHILENIAGDSSLGMFMADQSAGTLIVKKRALSHLSLMIILRESKNRQMKVDLKIKYLQLNLLLLKAHGFLHRS